METNNTEEITEKRRVAKTAIIILFCVLLERYSTAGISCECDQSFYTTFLHFKQHFRQPKIAI